MIKRSLIGGGVALLTMGLMFGRHAVDYVTTGARCMRTAIDEQVPIEFKIEQARDLIREIDPEVERNRHLVIREEVALEQLSEQIAKLESSQATQKEELMLMRAKLETGDELIQFTSNGHWYKASQVTRDMEQRFERFKTNEETLFSLRRTLNARRQSLTAAQAKLVEMQAARGQLQAEVAKLEARQRMVTVAQTSSEFDLDSSVLARATQLIQDVDLRLDVEERMLDPEHHYAEEIPVSTSSEASDIVSQVAEYFGSGTVSQTESLAAEVELDEQVSQY